MLTFFAYYELDTSNSSDILRPCYITATTSTDDVAKAWTGTSKGLPFLDAHLTVDRSVHAYT